MQLVCLFHNIEEFVEKIDGLDIEISTAYENMMKRLPTAKELETYKSNIFLRFKLNEQLEEIRNGK